MHGPINLKDADPSALDAFRAFMRTAHLHRQAAMRSPANRELGLAQTGALRLIAENDGIAQRDIAEMMHVSRPSVTTMLTELEREGLIARHSDDHDRRLTRVHLTDKGSALDQRMRSGFAAYVNRIFGTLSEDDRTQLARLLNLVGDAIEEKLAGTDEGTPGR